MKKMGNRRGVRPLIVIPCRGSSESMKLKNLRTIGNDTILAMTMKKAARLNMPILFCTDFGEEGDKIVDHIKKVMIRFEASYEIDRREHPARGDVYDVVNKAISSRKAAPSSSGQVGKATHILLLQPTSPFWSVEAVDKMIALAETARKPLSVQSICPIEHNNHWLNQRIVLSYDKNTKKPSPVGWRFEQERMDRERVYQKQGKPSSYRFGGLVLTGMNAFYQQQTFWASPSLPIFVDWREALDLDGFEDFARARAYMAANLLEDLL